jgi:hypothetical protein
MQYTGVPENDFTAYGYVGLIRGRQLELDDLPRRERDRLGAPAVPARPVALGYTQAVLGVQALLARRGPRLSVDVKVILTRHCIFCIENH